MFSDLGLLEDSFYVYQLNPNKIEFIFTKFYFHGSKMFQEKTTFKQCRFLTPFSSFKISEFYLVRFNPAF
jgi:hypothetical protein